MCVTGRALLPLKVQHKWAAEWSPDPDRPHIANLKVVESIALCGGRGGMLPGPVHVNVTQCGISQVWRVGDWVCRRAPVRPSRAAALLVPREDGTDRASLARLRRCP